MVEKSGFKGLLRTFDAKYQLPFRSYFSRTCYSDDSASQALNSMYVVLLQYFFKKYRDTIFVNTAQL